MKAFVEIEGLRVRANHGVMRQERTVGNVFEVSVMLEYPQALKAVGTDRVDDTLDYARAAEVIRGVMAEPSALLEHVAGRIRDALVAEWPGIASGRITVSKPAPPIPAEMVAARFTLEF